MPLAEHLMMGQGHKKNSELVFVVENNFPIQEKVINGHRVLSLDEFLSAKVSERRFNIAIANTQVRERIASSIPANLAKPFSITASNHVSLYGIIIGDVAILRRFTHVSPNAKIGRFFVGDIYSYIAHDCVIGDFVTFAPCVKCNGHVIVEDRAYVGTGAMMRDGTDKPMVIGRDAVVGIGSVVTKSVPAGVTVVGNPAKMLVK